MDKWDTQRGWHLTLPPGRPSSRHLALLRRTVDDLLADRAELRVAVLGSTPEFRSALSEYPDVSVAVLERNVGFFEHATSLAAGAITEEDLIVGDWFDTLPALAAQFDLVLSDLTSGNVPFNLRREFYRLIAGSLRLDGVFWDKVLNVGPSGRWTIAELTAHFSSVPENLQSVNDFCNVLFFASELSPNDECLVLPDEVRDVARQVWVSSPRMLWYVQASLKLIPHGAVWYYGRTWSRDRLEIDHRLVQYSATREIGSVFDRHLKIRRFRRVHG